MNLTDPTTATALVAGVLLLATALLLRRRQRPGARRAAAPPEALDTVQSWPPESARVLSIAERRAYDLLRHALPGFLVLSQVPLSRFLRVPTRHAYNDWLQRVGSLSADLLVCDSGSRVLAVIDIRSPQETDRSRRRHERMTRVLKAAGIRVHTWREDDLPTAAEVRTVLGAELLPASALARGQNSRPAPLIPVAEIEELLAAGDEAATDLAMEPVPSAFFEELEERGSVAQARRA